jgi:hypothetical protein
LAWAYYDLNYVYLGVACLNLIALQPLLMGCLYWI